VASLGELALPQSRLRWWARPSALGAAVAGAPPTAIRLEAARATVEPVAGGMEVGGSPSRLKAGTMAVSSTVEGTDGCKFGYCLIHYVNTMA